MSLTRAQVDTLLKPIKPRRVFTAQNQSHVAAFDVIAHLTRIFGFGGWSKEILDLTIVHERSTEPELNDSGQPKNQGRWWVTYSCTMRLTVCDPEGNVVATIEDAATGSAQNMPSPADAYDFAIKNAISYALKRCAKDLGDQFGLSLYNKGQTGALVGRTLVMPDGAETDDDVEEHAPTPLSMGNDEREPEPELPAPVVEAPDRPHPPTDAAMKRLFAALHEANITDNDRHDWASMQLDRDVTTFDDLSRADVAKLTQDAKELVSA